MSILVIEHHDRPSLGVVGETLKNMGVETHTVWAGRGDPVPQSPADRDGMILLGGAMNVMDDENYPYYPALMDLVRQFHDDNRPVLGICHGAQMIARIFGADISLNGEFEFGFTEISLTQEGRDDRVLGHMQSGHHLFQWHRDHYTLPPGAIRLARGVTYPNQGYRIGETTYATQFHFEVDQALVNSWIDSYMDFDNAAPGYEEWLPRQFDEHLAESVRFCTEMTRRWVDLTT